MQYAVTHPKGIQCQLCRHHCTLKRGARGICGVEKNVNDALVNLTYGYPEALNIDPIEKKPLYHLLPGSLSFSLGTAGCNFRCPFCQNHSLSQKQSIDTSRYISPEMIVDAAMQNGCSSVSYTYNEPIVFYPYARDIGMLAKEKGLKNIFVTSGYESDVACEDMQSWVDAANVDLKSFNKEYYKKSLKCSLEGVLETLRHLVRVNVFVEVTTLVIEGLNNSDSELHAMAQFIAGELDTEVPWHLSAFHPDYKMMNTPRTSAETLERAYRIGKKSGLHYVYLGNLGIDHPTCCPECNTKLIERRGFNVLTNTLKEGRCPQCSAAIHGIWA